MGIADAWARADKIEGCTVYVLTEGFDQEGERPPYSGGGVFSTYEAALAAGNAIAEEYGWEQRAWRKNSRGDMERDFGCSYLTIREAVIQ